MAWSFNGAQFLGNKLAPHVDDEVVIEIRDATSGNAQTLRFVFDGTLTKKQFVARVKAKVRSRLERLNGIRERMDASDDFRVEA